MPKNFKTVVILAVLMIVSFIIGISFEKNNLRIRMMSRLTGFSNDVDQYFISDEKLIGKPLTNDPLSKYQWNLRMILDGIKYAEISNNAPTDVIVAVIDHSVNVDHPDLINRTILRI